MPNRMLTACGYPCTGVRVGRSSELSRVCELNVDSIERPIAEHIAPQPI